MYSSIGKLQPSIEYTHSFIIFSFLEQLLIHHNAYACGGTSEPQAITILMLVQINFNTCTLAQVSFILWIISEEKKSTLIYYFISLLHIHSTPMPKNWLFDSRLVQEHPVHAALPSQHIKITLTSVRYTNLTKQNQFASCQIRVSQSYSYIIHLNSENLTQF